MKYTTGYISTPCVGYFNSPGIDTLEGTNTTAFSVFSKRHYKYYNVTCVAKWGKGNWQISKRHQWQIHKDDVRRQTLDVEMKLFENDGSHGHPITAGTGQ